jgi:DNA-binding SARP family transcriptional activator
MGAATLRIRLLGELDLRQGEGALPPLESARAESLLAYLLLHRDAPQPRQHLAFLLWPDSSEGQARTNLHHVLHNLRRALPEPDRFLEVSPRALRWRDDAPYWLDVAAFEEAVSRAERERDDGGLAALREAVELYGGDLLQGSYDEWLLGERERLRAGYLHALERIAALLEARGDPGGAVRYAERLLRHDPLHEQTYRTLMRLHDARGDRARALRVYHAGAATLERELGVEPSAATRATYEALLPRHDQPPAAPERPEPLEGPPLVGRAAERARLIDRWRAAEAGQAHLALVTGEAGVGKTRLGEELRSWCAHRGALTVEARCYPAEGALAYGPVVSWLRAPPLASQLERLDAPLLGQLARLLPELRAATPGLPQPEPLPPGEDRRLLFDALARAIRALEAPLLLVADDLHWADRETLRFLHYLLRVEPTAPLLLVATARREEMDQRHPLDELLAGLQALDRVSEIELARLSRQETAALAERFGGHPLPEPDAERLFAETEGNPLFVVEALRAGWSGGDGADGRLSPKVQAVISSRLAQLEGPAAELVAVAATVGREFTSEELAAAGGTDEGALVSGLDELWRRRIIRDRGPDAYDFTHDRIREVAYLAQSPARRRHTHLLVTRALQRLHRDDPERVAARVAAHYQQAGAAEEAIAWYERAAEAALRLPLDAEAIRLLERALELVGGLPPSRRRQERELAVLTALPASLGTVEGFSSERLAEVQRRGLELAAELGVEPRPPLLRSLALASLSRSDFESARADAERLRAGGERDGDVVRVVEAEYVLGIAAFWKGELHSARRQFEAAVEHYRPEHRARHLASYGLDPRVMCLGRLAITLWFLGHPPAAERAGEEALALADEIGHGATRTTALLFAALLAMEQREPELVRRRTEALLARPADQSLPARVGADLLVGYLEVLDGRAAVGIASIQGTLDGLNDADHAPGMHAIVARVLLEACVAAGDARAGLAAAGRALDPDDRVRVWESEARRLRGEFLARLGAPAAEVETELELALRVARRQGARMLALRAAASLLRQRLDRGDREGAGEARERLAAIAGELPDARDTHDLRDANALLSGV